MREDLLRIRPILEDLVSSGETCRNASKAGKLASFADGNALVFLFMEDSFAPLRCALELCELIRELPSLSIVMGIHSGPAALEAGPDGTAAWTGAGFQDAKALVQGGLASEIHLSHSYSEALAQGFSAPAASDSASPGKPVGPQRLFLIGAGFPGDDLVTVDQLRKILSTALADDGHELVSDPPDASGMEWARSLESRIRGADTVVFIASNSTEGNELQALQIEIALDERRKRGKPQILPVWVGGEPPSPASVLTHNRYQALWRSSEDTVGVVSQVRTALADGQSELDPERLDSTGGAISSNSKFYVRRPADAEFERSLRAHESIVLVKGPRQIGKTSLIGKGIRIAEEAGWRCAITDFQALSSRQLESEEHFYRVIATTLSLDLDFPLDQSTEWLPELGPNLNMGRFLRSLVASAETPLIWFIDEADRLFTSPYASSFFGLVRSWHNARATDRRGAWRRLTIVLGYATEAYLFIEDLNQSPFNVGTPVDLTMFTLADTVDLNERYGRPIQESSGISALYSLLGGQPFLTRRAFDVLVRKQVDLRTLLEIAAEEDGPFGDHLKRVHVSVSQLPFVWHALHRSMSPTVPADANGLARLVAAGVLVKSSANSFDFQCDLYRRFLLRYV